MNLQVNPTPKRFAAVVLAADRTDKDPITQYTGAACKAFAPVGSVPMIIRVVDALSACEQISSIILCGPPEPLLEQCPELKRYITSGRVIWTPNLDSPSRSAEKGVALVPDDVPVLLTTADHALLTTEIVQSFLQHALLIPGDAMVAAVEQQTITAAFPASKRTVIRLRDGGYCGCNLFVFKPAGRSLIGFWRQAEDLRKQPWRLIAKVLGFTTVWRYLLGTLTLQQALVAVSHKSGVSIQAIILSDPRAGIDVDKVEDLMLAESIVKARL
ncbi:MAG: nucleotidyltransferase family protein [Nitrosomonas sp.]|nr:MAG: nucleotidyltransferase family protein [Nitrosomonas sp.]